MPTISQVFTLIIAIIPHHLQTENPVRQNLPVKLEDYLVAGSHGDALDGLHFGVGQRRMEETGRVLFQVAEGNGDETDVGVEFLAVGTFDAHRATIGICVPRKHTAKSLIQVVVILLQEFQERIQTNNKHAYNIVRRHQR